MKLSMYADAIFLLGLALLSGISAGISIAALMRYVWGAL